ncbi:MAG: cbb3-type cytochrome oxidase assembly protein CcoS [Planctomycetota bacterium]|nr:cbb3-type cytochrome oxidase assembly protein CcoS [Planctomycetota bacterium]
MSVIFILLPLAVLIASCFLLAFIWAAKQGQFDDLDTPAMRVATGDDEREATTVAVQAPRRAKPRTLPVVAPGEPGQRGPLSSRR